MVAVLRVGCVAAWAAIGCGDAGNRTDLESASASASASVSASGETSDSTTPSASSGQTPADTDAASPNETTGDDDDDAIFDVGADPGTTTGATSDECAKVDVLYIIDNSPSMYDEQQTLIANFATFVADMQDALTDVEEYHIGVITTDDYQDGGFLDDGANSVNRSHPQCQELGGLVVEAQAGTCLPFADGNNFITQGDDLAASFSCIANVGEDGDSDELVGDALIELLASSQIANPVTDCNEGFIRDDALLVIVILTDENDSSGTSVDQWYQAVVASKGVPENAVVLSLIWEDSAPGCDAPFSETNGSQIIQFTERFPNHAVGNICDNSYAGFFSATLPLLESACENFEPPG